MILVGNHCQISPEVKFFTHGGLTAICDKYLKFDLYAKVSIDNNVIISANSIVAKDIPYNAISADNPCKVIKFQDK